MATVTGYTAPRMKEIEDSAIVSGVIVGNDLMLTRHDGSQINAGEVRGPQGPTGSSGDTSVQIVTSTTRPSNPFDGTIIYETDTQFIYSWSGLAWVFRSGTIVCSSTTRPSVDMPAGMTIYEVDTKKSYVWNGTAWVMTSDATTVMRCKVKRTTPYSIPYNTVQFIPWTTEEYDTNGIWTVGTADSLIIPSGGAGLWRFILSANYAINSAGIRHFGLVKNIESLVTFNSAGNVYWYVGGTIEVETVVAVGDVIKAYGFQTSNPASALNLDSYYPFTLSATRISA